MTSNTANLRLGKDYRAIRSSRESFHPERRWRIDHGDD
jgi:hypothetical protein